MPNRGWLASVCALALVSLSVGCGEEPKTVKITSDVAVSADVEDGLIVDAVDVSVITACSTDAECLGSTPRCDFAAGVCVPCLLDHHCDKGEVCLHQACAAPTTCVSDKACLDVDGVCDKVTEQCVECGSNDDCGATYTCRQRHCLPKPKDCVSSKDCSDLGGVCDKTLGFCVDCADDVDCTTTEFCTEGLCLGDVCAKGDTTCKNPSTQNVCLDNGSGWKLTPCATGTACDDGDCKTVICKPDAKRCEPAKTGAEPTASGVQTCDKRGVSWGAAEACAAKESCVDGACLPYTCSPGEQRCAPGIVETCGADGLSWTQGPCTATQACVEGGGGDKAKTAGCTEMICKPGTLVCDGDFVATCDATGLSKTQKTTCAKLPDGTGSGTVVGTCVAGACQPKACTDGAKACGAAAVLTCDKGSWGAVACADKETCSGGKCVAVSCVPNEVWCDLSVIKTCNAKGDDAAWVQDCKTSGKGCKGGKCVDLVCQPGKLACSSDASSADTCKVDGSGWVAVPCGKDQICAVGVCKKLVCAAGKSTCNGANVMVCDAFGTTSSIKETCGTGKACLAGACVAQICQPAESKCAKNGAVETCNGNGLVWMPSACPLGKACSAGDCKPVVCKASELSCQGADVMQCDPTGTALSKAATCAAGKVCSKGACLTQLCKSGETRCGAGATAGKVETCALDGLSYLAAGCPSGTACDAGACEAVICTAGAKSCAGAVPTSVPQICNTSGTQQVKGQGCKADEVCSDGACTKAICVVKETSCDAKGQLKTCGPNRLTWTTAACGDGKTCAGTTCQTIICSSDKTFCAAQDVMLCDKTGTAASKQSTCTSAEVCQGSVCLAKVCKSGETKCGTDGKILTCKADGLGWVTSSCVSGQTCAGTACKKLICTASQSFCAGQDVMVCDGTGTVATKKSTCSSSELCQAGSCLAKVCKGGETKCGADGKILTCKADGLGWVEAGCASGQTCAGTACKTIICVAGKSFCTGEDVMLCDSTGTAATKQTTCASGNLCVAGVCKKLVCKPGETACGVGPSAATVRTCAADGLAWVESSCGSGKTCDTGACKSVICAPNALSCSGKDVLQCNALGTVTTKLTTCGADKGCLKGACVPQVCVPNAVSCVGGKQRTCNGDGTAFTDKACASSYVCAGTECLKQICNPESKYCTASRIVSCLPDGTNWVSTIDCNKQQASCLNGECKKWLCTPKSLACKGDQLGTCADDGLSWKLASCSDNNACTPDSCADSKCVNGASKVCNDDDSCTADSCDKASGKCVTTPISGSCDDGTVCTTGETCTGGKCVAPVGGMVSTFAGTGTAGTTNGGVAQAKFNNPWDIVAAPDGTLFVSDYGSHVVRQISTSGQVTIFAGTPNNYGYNTDGKNGRFRNPAGLAYDGNGGVYVADYYNNSLRHVDATGFIKTVVVSPLNRPRGVATSADGTVLVADTGRHVIRRYDPIAKTTVIVAGVHGSGGFTDGPAASARFYNPFDVAEGKSGRVYVADYSNHRIRLIFGGQVTTLAGSGSYGLVNAQGGLAKFNSPSTVMVDGQGNLLVFELGNHVLRGVTQQGLVSTVAFSGVAGMSDGPADKAALRYSYGMAPASGGAMYLADYQYNRIRKLLPGAIDCSDGNPCTTDSCDAKTGACSHKAVSVGAKCDDGDACVLNEACDTKGACVGKAKDCDDGKQCTKDLCDVATGICSHPAHEEGCSDGDGCTTGDGCKAGVCVGGLGVIETAIGTGSAGSQDGPAKSATLYGPYGVSVSDNGVVWWVDASTHRVRKMTTDGTVTTVAGSAAGYADGPGAAAKFSSPQAIATAKGGIVFVCDTGNRRVRRVSPAGVVSTYAGDGNKAYVDGPAAQARFADLVGITVTADGAVVVSDQGNQRIRAISTTGIVTTLAGSGTAGYLDGPGSSARFNAPRGVAVGAQGDVYVTDVNNYRIRKVAPNGLVTTVAGVGTPGFQDGAASSAKFSSLYDLAVMADGSLLLNDYGNGKLRRIDQGTVSTMIEYGTYTDGALHIARLTKTTFGVDVARNGDVWLTDPGSQRIRVLKFGKASCDDGEPCTTDLCDKTKGCTHTATQIGNACDDGDACTTNTVCSGVGTCAGTTKSCDDGNGCTTDSCDPYLGACANEANTLSCDDSTACTTGESCYEKSCTAELPKLTTLAGSTAGYTDGKGASAQFKDPFGMTRVGADLWVADFGNHRIRKVTPDGTVSLVAGSGSAKFEDGVGSAASFYYPMALDAAPDGSVLVADRSNQRIRRISGKNVVSTYAGSGVAGYLDGALADAKFNNPSGLAVDGKGQVVVSDTSNYRIRLITTAGKVTTLAGAGSAGFVDGPASSARFNNSQGVDFDATGDVYVADSSNHRLRKISQAGTVTTVVGASNASVVFGPASSAAVGYVSGVTVAPNGVIYLSLPNHNRVVKLSGGKLTPLFGGPSAGSADGVLDNATLSSPARVTSDALGQLYVSETGSDRIRVMAFAIQDCDDGSSCTTDSCNQLTGKCDHQAAIIGSKCSDGDGCSLDDTCDAQGACSGAINSCEDNNVCTTDSCNTLTGACSNAANTASCDDGDACTQGETCWGKSCQTDVGLVTTIAGSSLGYVDGAATNARFRSPWDLVQDAAGTLYIADRDNHRIRKMTKDGKVTTFAGSGTAGYLDGAGSSAKFTSPSTLLLRKDGSLVVYGRGARLRTVSATGTVGTLAGSGTAGLLDGYVTSSQFQVEPGGLAEDGAGVLYITDINNHRIRTLNAANNVATFAGSSAGYADGASTSAKFSAPQDIAFGPDGALYVADANNRRIRKVADGTVTTIAGAGTNGWSDGAALTAQFSTPETIDVDALGRIFVVDSASNQRIRMISGGKVSTVAGNGAASSVDGFATSASFYHPQGATLGTDGHLYIAETSSHRIRRLLMPKKICDDGKPCTLDSCDKLTGSCSFVPQPAGADCVDSGKPCLEQMTCGAGGCQGGVAKACDDLNACSTDSCDAKTGACKHVVAAGCAKYHRVFLTSATFDGNLGGIAGADAKCEAAAASASLGGSWQAWLSDHVTYPALTFPQLGASYRRLDGAVIATSWADLVDGSIASPINVDESGKNVTAASSNSNTTCSGNFRPKVHTGTYYNGNRYTTSSSRNCLAWKSNTTSGSSSYGAGIGVAGVTNSQWSYACNTDRCYSTYRGHLYCFEKTVNFGK